MKKNNPSLTIGISTRCGGPDLIKIAQGILDSKDVDPFRFILIADSQPLGTDLIDKLTKMGVEVTENKESKSLPFKLKQKIDMCETDLIIFTHDDVMFEPDAIANVIKEFKEDPSLTMSYVNVKPFPPESFFESIIAAGMRLSYRIGTMWRKADNYMMANGQCMVFRADHLRKMEIPENVTNIDIFFYFENKRIGGKFKHIPNAVIYKRSPQKMSEHLNQSSRFQYSQHELSRAMNMDLSIDYKIPFTVLLKALFLEFLKSPIYILCYIGVAFYTRRNIRKYEDVMNPLWKADVSTKKIA